MDDPVKDVRKHKKTSPLKKTQKGTESPIETRGDHSMALASLCQWDVTMPPFEKKKGVGQCVKNIISRVSCNFLYKYRRITVELYKKITPEEAKYNVENEPRVFPTFHPMDTTHPEEGSGNSSLDEDFLIFRILKEDNTQKGKRLHHFANDDGQSTVSLLPNGVLESNILTTYNVTDYGDGQNDSALIFRWREHFRAHLSTMSITNAASEMVEIEFCFGGDNGVCEFYFDDPDEAQTFVQVFKKMEELQCERGIRMAAEHRMAVAKEIQETRGWAWTCCWRGKKNTGFLSLIEDATTHLYYSKRTWSKEEYEGAGCLGTKNVQVFIEIVSASNLSIADGTSSDPYVCVQDGRKLWHKTDVVSKSLNPVWTLPTGSFFFIKSNLNDFFGITTHIEFVLKDNSIVGKNSFLGSCLVNKTDLLNGKGDRVCFPLTRISRAKKEALTSKKKSFLTLRFRPVTANDVRFDDNVLRHRRAKEKNR